MVVGIEYCADGGGLDVPEIRPAALPNEFLDEWRQPIEGGCHQERRANARRDKQFPTTASQSLTVL